MDIRWLIALVIPWLACGWWGGRLMKRSFTLWTASDEWMARTYMLLGIMFLIVAMFFTLDDKPVKRSWF